MVDLKTRIGSALFLSREFSLELFGCVWDPNDVEGSKHMGIVHRIRIDSPEVASAFRKKEFRKKRGHGMSGSFLEPQRLRNEQDSIPLESWSQIVLKNWKED